MKKIVLKRLLISLVFVAIFIACYAYLCLILMPKDMDDLGGEKYYSTLSYKTEKDNTLDFVLCGNSDAYSGFSPIEFYKQTGATSYICSAAKQPAKGVEKDVKYMFKHHDLKLVIIDVDCLFFKNAINEGTLAYEFANVIAPIRYHARWKELEPKDFYTWPKLTTNPLKGYMPQGKIRNYTLPNDYMANTNAKPKALDRSVIKNVKNIARLCKENNAELMFICLPTPHSWSNAKSNAITKLANELGVPFVDFNLPQENFTFDFAGGFRDKGNHLNIYGATSITDFLVDYLNRYNLPDHRNDSKYQDWNDIVPYYESHIEALKGENK